MTPLEIDFPDDPAGHYFDDRLLIEAVQRAEGHVHVGFKRPELPKLPERAVQRAEGRRAVVEAIDASQILEALRFLVAQGAEITMQYQSFPAIAAVIPSEMAPRIREHPLVDFVEPITSAELAAASQVTPNNISKIRAPQAWAQSTGSNVNVVILDSGIPGGTSHHSDLPPLTAARCMSTHPFEPSCADTPANPNYGHGAAVAGIVLAMDNGSDVVGVAPSVLSSWTSIRVCYLNCPHTGVAAALNWVAQNGRKDIVNMSFSGAYDAATAMAVANAYNAGDLLVASAGNSAEVATVSYPAGYSEVIAVSGTTANDQFHPGSVYGPKVELSAPYEALSLHPTFGTKNVSGTSFASPAVAGVAALVWSKNPGWSNVQVRQKLQQSVEDLGTNGRDIQYGYGRIDACFAVDAGCTSIYPLTAYIAGPTEIQPGAFCTWQVIVDGGRTPYTYNWSGALSGSNHWIQGPVHLSGWLDVSVTATDGQNIVDSIYVTTSSSAPPCTESP